MKSMLLSTLAAVVLVSMTAPLTGSLDAQTGDSVTANWEREAAAAALAFLDAEERLPARWVAAPYVTFAGRPMGTGRDLPVVHPTREAPATRTLFACDEDRCTFLPDFPGGPTPVMTRVTSSDESGVLLLVSWPVVPEELHLGMRYGSYHASVQVHRDEAGNPVPRLIELVSAQHGLVPPRPGR
jgi:hypothetical protein